MKFDVEDFRKFAKKIQSLDKIGQNYRALLHEDLSTDFLLFVTKLHKSTAL
jgi:hypothetical protein